MGNAPQLNKLGRFLAKKRMTFCLKICCLQGATTFSITTFSIMTLSIKPYFSTFSINDTQHK